MALVIADIASAAGILLNDVDAVRWTPATLSTWIAECHIYLATIAPAVCVERGPQPIVNGPVQPLATTVLSMARIYGICDGNGIVSSALTECTDKELFLENPAWMSGDAAVPIHYAKAAGDMRKFYLYPFYSGEASVSEEDPSIAGIKVLMDYVSVPVTAAEIDWTVTDPPGTPLESISAFDVGFQPLFVDYILYRAFGEDADHAANMQLSDNYFNSFAAKLAALAEALGAGEIKAPRPYRRKVAE